MKIKTPKAPWKVIRTEEKGTTKWYIGERWRKDGDGTILLYGKVIDLTDTIEPYMNHCNDEVTILTNVCGKLIDANLKLQGLTVTERDRNMVWKEMLSEVESDKLKKGKRF